MMNAIRLKPMIQKNGELHLTNLPVFAGRQVEVLLLYDPESGPKKPLTARRLLNSGLIGLWKDRTDIADSAEYARHLRDQAQRRQR